jgi:hypothetical protein
LFESRLPDPPAKVIASGATGFDPGCFFAAPALCLFAVYFAEMLRT